MVRKQKTGESTYAELFVMFSCSVEKWLKRLLLILLIALVVFQLLLRIADVRYFLTSVERQEGVFVQPEREK